MDVLEFEKMKSDLEWDIKVRLEILDSLNIVNCDKRIKNQHYTILQDLEQSLINLKNRYPEYLI